MTIPYKDKHMKHTVLILWTLLGLASCKTETITESSEHTRIEEKFQAKGDNAVGNTIIKSCNSKEYKVFYPSPMTGKAPVITWGNGTGLSPDNYERIFNHLASWGFIVVDNFEGETLDGSSILESAQCLIQENSDPRSLFYQKIDIDHIGASGHSQGAGGIVNAHTEHAEGIIIKTLAPVAFPSLLKAHPNKVKVPIFFITGANDDIFSSVAFNTNSYNSVPPQLAAVMGARRGAFHDAIMGTELVTGYLTAWMRYQLMGDQDAASAFTGVSPEIAANPNWNNVSLKSMP